MKIHIAKVIVKILAVGLLLWLCVIGYALYDLKPKEYVLAKDSVKSLNEEVALELCRRVLMKELNLQSNQIEPIPYQEPGKSLLAQNESLKNEGSIIWYVSSSGFDPTHAWHIHTKIVIRENDILVIVSKPK
ncbi:MAG: hypothetical protein EOO52_07030 [Gammaproteobacteria bacterium]|nr:MAG: hypothetical protein EOO52_07030 [Gammaproteobacteria bacterium]